MTANEAKAWVVAYWRRTRLWEKASWGMVGLVLLFALSAKRRGRPRRQTAPSAE